MDFVIIVKIRFLSDQYSNLPLTQWTNMKKLLFQSIYFCKSCQLKCPKNISLRSVCSTYNMVSYTTKKVAYTNKSKSNPHKYYYNKGFFFCFSMKDQRQYNCSKEGHSMTKGNLNIREKFKIKTKGDFISESFFILGQICKKNCQITFLTTFYLGEQCSGV